ncbi:CopG family transcriptional regulator [Aphanothece hegewaldii CCALA 016]|uniref:CopG family transcriptional regulator n=1 Tax=Aphanothece hegewaldii CCALA 016 TaxID=2107694 RepID=A0A2T1LWE8_9CHRO|nr:CopG family transcriptional regulator [Aphanothece hegewaldii CCALA 016]
MERLEIQLPKQEKEILEKYCQQTNRTMTDVLRSYIRGLKQRLKKGSDC